LLALGLRYQLANPEKTRGGFTQITEIMTRDPKVIPFDFILKDAGLKMRELDVGMLPISKDDRLVGMLTDRDITVRATAGGCDPAKTKVSDVHDAGSALLL